MGTDEKQIFQQPGQTKPPVTREFPCLTGGVETVSDAYAAWAALATGSGAGVGAARSLLRVPPASPYSLLSFDFGKS